MYLKFRKKSATLSKACITGSLKTKKTKQINDIRAGFRKAHMCAFCYSICDMNYRQMRAYKLYGIQPRIELWKKEIVKEKISEKVKPDTRVIRQIEYRVMKNSWRKKN